MSLELEARQTKDREFQYHHNIEVNSEQLDALGVTEGEKLVVRNHRKSPHPACVGRVHLRDDLDDDAVGLGFTLRYATGTPEGETVRIETPPKAVAERSLRARISDRIFGKRPVICRVRMAVEPDPGFRVCRITDETKELLGIGYGDRIVVESATDRAQHIKALPQKGRPEEIKQQQKEDNPERYPSCFDEVNIEGVRGTKIDVPEIYVDRDLRSEAGVVDESVDPESRDATDEGVCQPVVVYRDTTTLFGRVFLEIATPLVIGAVVAAVGFETALLERALDFDPAIILLGKVALLLVALFIVVGAVWFKTRVVLLD